MAITQAHSTTETTTEKGISLARGPALLTGTVLLAAGLYFLYKAHYFPKLSNFPNGAAPVDTKVFGIFGANGWTGMLMAVAGGLLLFGAAQHLLAKTMSLIVGIALAAAAIIALASGNVLGLAAANGWTELAWGVVAAVLVLNTLVPRRRRTVALVDTAPRTSKRSIPGGQPVGANRTPAPTGPGAGNGNAGNPVPDRERPHTQSTIGDREGRYADEPEAGVRSDARPYTPDASAERESRYTDGPAADDDARYANQTGRVAD
jgi:hypothetical protein